MTRWDLLIQKSELNNNKIMNNDSPQATVAECFYILRHKASPSELVLGQPRFHMLCHMASFHLPWEKNLFLITHIYLSQLMCELRDTFGQLSLTLAKKT